ncbi:MAG: septum site-determining protein MinD, partial [Desulfobacterales bacterium]|nr:septum site-determining protein MinD [Desulfobacterales bacterium]
RVIGLLYARSLEPKLIVNRIEPARVERGEMLSHEDVMEVLSIDLLGLVPMDEKVLISSNTGTPLVLQNDAKAGQAFKRIAQRLTGNVDVPIEVPTHKTSVWKKISRTLGMNS